MFLHLGGDVIIPKDEVIAIIDMEAKEKSEVNRDFLRLAEDEEFVHQITNKRKAKSFIITLKNLYYSPISSITLKKRSEEALGIDMI